MGAEAVAVGGSGIVGILAVLIVGLVALFTIHSSGKSAIDEAHAESGLPDDESSGKEWALAGGCGILAIFVMGVIGILVVAMM